MIRKYLNLFVNFFISSLFILFLAVVISGSTIVVVIFGVALSEVFTIIVMGLSLVFILFLCGCGCVYLQDRLVDEIMEENDNMTEKDAEYEANLVVTFIVIFAIIALALIPITTGILFF